MILNNENMETTVNDRIRLIYKSNNITLKDFSSLTEIPESTLRNMFSRGTQPSFEAIQKIAYRYKDYSLEWLITGEGEMIKEGPVKTASPEILTESEFVAYLKSQVEELKEDNERLMNDNNRLREQSGYYKGLLDTNGIAYKQTAS